MDTSSINQPVVESVKSSRLPAGSTLEIAPGVHVPHPHAEVNLPGIGDPRLGDTKAVTEFAKVDKADPSDVVFSYEQKPLADEVKPKVVTVNPDAKTSEADASAIAATSTATTEGAKLAVELPTLNKTE
jgi:hypothetical protein